MKILIVGGGGREHALAWAMARSPRRPALYIAPGNAGTAALGRNVALAASDIDGLLSFAKDEGIDLTVVGPEQPLVLGIVDRFASEGLKIVGPSAAAARLEGSKEFAKAFMERHGIPTAAYRSFSAEHYDAAVAYVNHHPLPLVVKADGLAAGKGVLICASHDEARQALNDILNDRRFGEAGARVVVEAFMQGEEASVFALTDGDQFHVLAAAQDHKRIGEGDTGPNTGGMGAYAPAPIITPERMEEVCARVIEPTLAGMREEGHPYRGFLYCGLMMTGEGPKVVEFNCRMGDPETQVVLPLLETDLVEACLALAEGRLGEVPLDQAPGAAACVVLASAGYPGHYEKGFRIEGLEQAEQAGALVFHAGTRLDGSGAVVTTGGRVLAVTGRGDSLAEALDQAYRGVESIAFEGMQYRRDIGRKGLRWLADA